MNEPRFRVIALAGGLLESDFRRAGYDVANKAYLPVGGELMIERVLRALQGSSSVSEIRCVTQKQALTQAPRVRQMCAAVIEPGPDLIGSVLRGIDGVPDGERVLVSATDMPLLTSEAVDNFTSLAARTPCDIGYGFVERSVHERRFASVRHTWVHLREGTFCGGGMSVLRAGAIRKVQDTLRAFTSARKSPLKMASLFSLRFFFRLLTGQLSVSEVEEHASRLTGLVCRGIVSPDPAIAVNIDRLEDLRTVETFLR